MSAIGADVFVKSITFNDNTNIQFGHSDIVVFTGPNNSGKSQVLKDIARRYMNSYTREIVTKSQGHDFVGEPTKEYLKEVSKGYDGNYKLGIHPYGTYQNAIDMWKRHDMSILGSLFLTVLPTESRLTSSNAVNSIDFTKDKPSNPLQVLYMDDEKTKELDGFFYNAFGVHLILNKGAGSKITLHVGNEVEIKEGEDRVSSEYLKRLVKLPLIEQQGDGMRSFSGVLLNIIAGNTSVTLLDEPEAFLHPPQARLLGEILAKHTHQNKQLFISTHSEDFLKGLLTTGKENVRVVRINREGDINHMSLLDNEGVRTLWKDPILRFSNILSGLFHSKVVICEADTDCRFYQSVVDSIVEKEARVSPDILFTHCGGKDRLKTVVSSLKTLNVKVATIVDIDVLNNKKTFSELLESAGGLFGDVESEWNTIDDYVKHQRPQLNTEDVKKEIETILAQETQTTLTLDAADKIKRQLRLSSAWSKIKEVGYKFFTGGAYNAYLAIDDYCRQKGIFIVPVGELEFFYRKNSHHGVKWVTEVLESVNIGEDKELEEARNFMLEVLGY